jgi:predicted aminopeptidase
LSASKPLAFESYSWSFPFFGGFSYKGFFDLEMALHEKRKLDALGYDVDLGKASAWSTLGWFPDPITASMLKKKPYDFAELLFHELVHKTVYLNDSVEWNENLAVLCARQLCLDFLMKMNRKDLHDEYLQSLRAEDSLLAFASDRQARLRAFYVSDACSLSGKSIFIRQYAQDFLDKEWSRFFPREKVAAAMLYERNAWFLSHQRYGGGMKELHEQLYHQHHGSVKDFLESLVQHYGS